MKLIAAILVLVGLALFVGCGKTNGAGGREVSPPAQIPAAVTEQNAAAVTQELTMAMHRYRAAKGQFPTTLDEVLAAKFIDKLPAAPAGKRFAIDAANFQVVLVNQ